MSNELTLQEAALAWAQGKRVEARPFFRNGGPWNTISRVGAKDSSCWPASILNEAEAYEFRIATEPTAKKFRPWTSEEVPVGAIVRTVGVAQPFRWLIVAACSEGITTCGGSTCITHKHQWLTDSCECSTDNGKTWLPCGVEVEA